MRGCEHATHNYNIAHACVVRIGRELLCWVMHGSDHIRVRPDTTQITQSLLMGVIQQNVYLRYV